VADERPLNKLILRKLEKSNSALREGFSFQSTSVP